MKNLLKRGADLWLRLLGPFAGNPQRAELSASLLARLAAASLCVLVAATWTLWSPSKVPHVPFVRVLANVPAWLEGGLLQVFGLSAVIGALCGNRSVLGRWALAISAASIALLALADQQRLQPWAYQIVILSLVLVALSAAEAIATARLLVASVYFFSAFSKLDRSFLESGGGQIVDGLLQCLRASDLFGANGRTTLAACFAVGELLIAVGLCSRRLRKFAWPASIVMHVLLLLALSPWGADNKPGVLIWNVYFIAQNVILFGVAGEATTVAAISERAPKAFVSGLRWAVRATVLFVVLFPLTAPFGLCDVWPAWAVYATGPERLRMFIDAADRDKLSPATKEFVQPPRFEDNRCLVRIDRLSLDGSGAPIYPQNRFRLGVVLAIADSLSLGEQVFVEVDGPADRFTGQRTTRQLQGRSAVVAEVERYWLNGFPRENPRPAAHQESQPH